MAESEIPADILATAERIALAFNSLAQECLILDKPPAEAVSFGATHIARALLAERRSCSVIARDAALYSGCPVDFIADEIADTVLNAIRQDNPNASTS